jgi:hypothetical protein
MDMEQGCLNCNRNYCSPHCCANPHYTHRTIHQSKTLSFWILVSKFFTPQSKKKKTTSPSTPTLKLLEEESPERASTWLELVRENANQKLSHFLAHLFLSLAVEPSTALAKVGLKDKHAPFILGGGILGALTYGLVDNYLKRDTFLGIGGDL